MTAATVQLAAYTALQWSKFQLPNGTALFTILYLAPLISV